MDASDGLSGNSSHFQYRKPMTAAAGLQARSWHANEGSDEALRDRAELSAPDVGCADPFARLSMFALLTGDTSLQFAR